MSQSWLSAEVWDSVMDGLVRADYSLLLGAGASVGSVNGMGEPLPIGGQLRQDLLRHYNIPVDPDSELPSLRATYDLAVQISEFDNKEQPAMYVRRKLSECTVPDWYRHLVRVPWRIIWNLNVDDVLEHAYHREFAEASGQRLHVTSWDNPQAFHRERASAVTAVHLHGRAKKSNMIFGSLEYLSAVAERGSGHELFRQTWPLEPMVVVGATLSDEIDMNQALLRPRTPREGAPPSVVVLKSVSRFDRFRLEKAGLIAIEATGEQFFAAVRADWESASIRLDDEERLKVNGVHPAAGYFLQHFRQVDRLPRPDPRHDFYSGHEPDWSDIKNQFDVTRTLGLEREPISEFPQDKIRIVAFHGGPLTGKSTAELRFAESCSAVGLKCYRYDDGKAFDPELLFWYFKHNPTSVLIVDDLVDFRGELDELIGLCEESEVGLRMMTTLRDTRLHLLTSVKSEYLRTVRVSDRLKDNEIRELIEKLRVNHRLNLLASYENDQARYNFFKITHKASLIAGLESATRGRAFSERVRDDYERAVKSGDREVATILLLSAEVGYPLELGTIASTAGISAALLRDKLRNSLLGDLALEDDSGNVRTRQPGLAARVFREDVPEKERYDCALGVARSIAPHINPLTIRMRTRYARLGGQLMSARRVMNWLGASMVDDWYAELKDTYEWNARYWEQRALAECSQVSPPRYELAEAWAREAVERYEDSYSLNTLAKVLFRRALMHPSKVDDELFEQALSVVESALSNLERSSEYPYVTALTYLTHGFERSEPGSVQAETYRRRFNHWIRDAEDADAFRYPHGRVLLVQRREAWLKVVAGDPAPTDSVLDDGADLIL